MAKQGKNSIIAVVAVFLLVLAMVLTVVLVVGEQNPQPDPSYPQQTVLDETKRQPVTEAAENTVPLSGKYLWEYGRPANNADDTQQAASQYSSEN